MSWKFEWITNWETIYSEAFQQQWLNWYCQAENCHIFSHPVLGMAWIETYRKIWNISPLFCIAKIGAVTIFMPLILWKKNWKNGFQRVIVPLGHSDFDYHDPLISIENNNLLDSFFLALPEEIRNNKSFDKIEINGIRSAIHQNGWTQEPEYCPYCDLENFKDSNDYLSSLKTSLRGDLQRQTKRLKGKGELTLYSYSVNSIERALSVLPEFLEYHCKRWPNAWKAPGLHQRIIECGLPLGIVDFSELRIDNVPISWHLGFRDEKRFYYYMPAINPEFAVYSPGKVHLWYLIEQSMQEGIKIFDHLRGNENYKSGWTNKIQKLYSYTEKSPKIASRIRNWTAEEGKNLLKGSG